MKLIPSLFMISVLILDLSSSATFAQEKTDPDLFKLSLEELTNVVITPSKLPQSAGNVTQKIDYLDPVALESTVSGNRNICEIIGRLPGASISVLSRNDANWGAYGGIGPKYSTYLLNGVPIDAFIDPMSLDLNAIDHIEVQRGPASVFYPNYLSQDFAGCQSPLAGTVNFVLKERTEKPLTLFSSSFGSYNTLNTQLFHHNSSTALSYFAGLSYESSDYTNYGTEGSWLNMKKNPEYQKTKLFGGTTISLDDDADKKIDFFCQETWHTGDKGRVYQGYDFDYGILNLGYSMMLSETTNLQSHIGIRKYNREWQNSNFGFVDTLKSSEGVNQVIIPADISFAWSHLQNSVLSVGMDNQSARYSTWVDPLTGQHNIGNKSMSRQSGFYAQEEWRQIKNLVIRAGMRYALIKNEISLVNGNNPAAGESSWSKLLWSAGLRYTLTENLSVFSNGGSSFATPSLKSIGGTIPASAAGVPGMDGQLPNAGLQPENGISVDVGTEFKNVDGISVGARVFFTKLTDPIVDNVISRTPSQTQSVNTGYSKCLGSELEFGALVNSFFSFSWNLTLLSSKIENNLDADQDGLQIPFSPKVIMNLIFSLTDVAGFNLTAHASYTDGYYDAASKASRKFFKPGVLVSMYVARELMTRDDYMLTCFLELYNLTNNRYEMPWQFKNTGFSCMAGIRLSF